MDLKPAARLLYTLQVTATDIDGSVIANPGTFAASFDDGVTWTNGTKDVATGWWQWLVAGALADATGAVAVLTGPEEWIEPQIRLVDNPEIVVEDAPRINLT